MEFVELIILDKTKVNEIIKLCEDIQRINVNDHGNSKTWKFFYKFEVSDSFVSLPLDGLRNKLKKTTIV